MRSRDLLSDEKPEPEPVPVRVGGPSTAERVENELLRRRRNGIASIGHFDDDLAIPAVDPHLDRGLRLGMLHRVSDEIGDQLVQAIAVPYAGQVALHVEVQRLLWMRQLRLADHLPADLDHVDAPGIDRDATAKPAAREIDQLLDDPRGLRNAVRDPPHQRGLLLPETFAPEEDVRGHLDRAKRVSKIVAHNPDELLAKFSGLVETCLFQSHRGLICER